VARRHRTLDESVGPRAHRRTRRPPRRRGCRVVPGLRRKLARADCVVATAGYNTVCDVLSFRRPAVLVPRAGPSLEQTLRADRLEEWETVEVVRAADLSGENVATAIQRALTRERLPAQRAPLDGLRRALDVFDTTLEQTEAA